MKKYKSDEWTGEQWREHIAAMKTHDRNVKDWEQLYMMVMLLLDELEATALSKDRIKNALIATKPESKIDYMWKQHAQLVKLKKEKDDEQ